MKTNISVTKRDSKSVVVSLKKRIVHMLADCFGRFNLWICLETSNVCELRNILKENGVCVLLELKMVESYTFTKQKSKKKHGGHDLQ